MTNQPPTHHPEQVDPDWFQVLVRRALEREIRRLSADGCTVDEALERGMWYVFELRNNLTDLYKAGAPGLD